MQDNSLHSGWRLDIFLLSVKRVSSLTIQKTSRPRGTLEEGSTFYLVISRVPWGNRTHVGRAQKVSFLIKQYGIQISREFFPWWKEKHTLNWGEREIEMTLLW